MNETAVFEFILKRGDLHNSKNNQHDKNQYDN